MGFTLAARSLPATTVGGDFYDVTPLGNDTLVIGVGDASGHGLGAALLARDVVTGIRMGAERELKITETVTKLNRVIHRSALSSRFVSLFYAELEANGSLFYVNAGHPAPWIVGPWGTRRLTEGGSILGPVAEAEFERGFARLEPGDRLAVVTDGFTERPDPAGRFLGEEGVERVLAATGGADAPAVLEALFTAATDHGRGRPRVDDTTALVVARDPA
jgi:sigma-B regulation protein RsbU (phosphoserine phosphatase)